jgi:hypothetical protein
MKHRGARSAKSAAVAAVVLLTIGCARTERAAEAEAARTALIGLGEEELLACAGRPVAERRGAEGDVLIYESADSALIPVPSVAGTATTTGEFCRAAFTLREGRVVHLAYRGQSGGLLSPNQQCAFIVRDCLARARTE